jgi:branched-chain amino acid transport system ATP-binding protein
VLHHGQQIAEGRTDQVLSDPRVVDAYLGKRRQ